MLVKTKNLKQFQYLYLIIKQEEIKKNLYKNVSKNKMRTIKNFLLERGLIKIGSSCPNNVLSAMYENSVMSGDLINTNSDTLLHNFVKSESNNDDE